MQHKAKFFILLLIGISCLLPFSVTATEQTDSGLNLYYVRHAETEANRTGHHTEENVKIFSPNGKQQLLELPLKLEKYQFDHIFVSPKWRTLHTILPYLKEHNLKAEIWPELEECCWQEDKNVAPSDTLPPVKKIELSDDLKPFFKFRDENSSYWYESQNYADGLIQIQKVCDMISSKFSQSGKTILLVGHGCAGSRIFEILQGKKPDGKIGVFNAKITYLKEQKNNKFKIISLNEQ